MKAIRKRQEEKKRRSPYKYLAHWLGERLDRIWSTSLFGHWRWFPVWICPSLLRLRSTLVSSTGVHSLTAHELSLCQPLRLKPHTATQRRWPPIGSPASFSLTSSPSS